MPRRPNPSNVPDLVNRLESLRVAHGYKSCYLSGPMTGLPDFNVEAFERAFALLQMAGWDVSSPAKHDEELGVILRGHPDGDVEVLSRLTGFDFATSMAWDLEQVCKTDCTIVMPGWEESFGANLEVHVANSVGKKVYTLLNQREIRAEDRAPSGSSQEFSPDSAQSASGEAGGADPASPTPPRQAMPETSADRKDVPITTGVFDYFPAALAEVAKVSKYGNDKHNPGQPLHHARGKSMDHADCIGRHLIDRGLIDPDTGMRHSGELAWRALALLQEELEDAGEAPLARGAKT